MKTANLDGLALEWAVVKAHGWEPKVCHQGEETVIFYRTPNHSYWCRANYQTSQHACMTLIEHKRISVFQSDAGHWSAQYPGWLSDPSRKHPFIDGPTAMVAVYRCYVASRLGEEIDIPKELQ
jgi:hypothetical protein